VAELSGKALESKHFKEIITGEATDARELFKMPVFFHPIALHIWATNKTASFFGGIDEGVKRRLIIFPFDKPILQDKQISGIAKQIIQEEGYLVLAWALKGLMRVVMNEDYVIPQICHKALENWIGQSDSAIGFTQECVRFEEGLPFKSTQDIYDNFREWHIKEGHDKYRIISKNAFGRKLNANLPKGIIPKQTEQSRGYINLKLINVSEHHTEQSNIVSFSKYGSHK
jgi:phage/plasmid-associated DNA primase